MKINVQILIGMCAEAHRENKSKKKLRYQIFLDSLEWRKSCTN